MVYQEANRKFYLAELELWMNSHSMETGFLPYADHWIMYCMGNEL